MPERIYQTENHTLERESFQLIPSREVAWIIGVLANGGSTIDRRIEMQSIYPGLINEFQTIGERVFGKNCILASRTTGFGPGIRARFYTTRFAERFGDLRRPNWPNTILTRHNWIIENTDYIWGFLEGSFERIGGVHKPKRGGIEFYTIYPNIANFFIDLLVRVDIENPQYNRRPKSQFGIEGVIVRRYQDIITLAQNIHSTIPFKEEALEVLRNMQPPSFRRIENLETLSQEELLREWVRITAFLQRPPTIVDILRFKKFGYTPYPPEAYNRHLGKNFFE